MTETLTSSVVADSSPRDSDEVAVERCLIKRTVTEDHVCVLTFDRPDSAANIFDKATLVELNEHLDFIGSNPQFKGLVLASAKKGIFIAGADLHSLSTANEQGLREIIELGQVTFNRIEDLQIPTVAAIHGAAVGGGYEICLACDYRIASSDKGTKIGLPETLLGLIPAWGGSTRLPRLIGLPKALDVILAGKTVAAKLALKLGMVDEVVPKEYVVSEALKRIARGRALKKRRAGMMLRASNAGLVATLLRKRIEPMLQKKTRGNYPAVFKALEVATEGIRTNRMESLLLERAAIIELTKTEACKNLIRVFFLQERAKKLKVGRGIPAEPRVKKIAVIGAGVMGAGIAQWAAARDTQVILRDIGIEPLAKGMATITKLFNDGTKRHVFTKTEARAGIDRVFPSPGDVPLKNTGIVIEAAVEKMELKKKIFARLSELSGPKTILATNTSALSVSELASGIQDPSRVVGIHFFNPVHRMQLVEVIVGKQTSPEVVQRSVEFVQQLGKLPVVVKDSPGFLVNRILMPYLIEAGHLFENGARVEDIDETMLEFGMPMGPLRLTDEVGVDVGNHVGDTIAKSFSPRLANPAVLEKMMKAGLLGKKSGRGFYVYTGRKERVNPGTESLRAGVGAAGLERKELQTRMVMLMLNEAARCLEENLVGEADDVDFGMIMGTGFAPFTGGPLRFADHVGIQKIVEDMTGLAGRAGERFAPCALLVQMAKENQTFYK